MRKGSFAACALALLVARPSFGHTKHLYDFGFCPETLAAGSGLVAGTVEMQGGNPIVVYNTATKTGGTVYTLPGEGQVVAILNGVIYGWYAVSDGNAFEFYSIDPGTRTLNNLLVFPNGAAPSALSYHKGIIYGVSNNGGPNHLGQVFKYTVSTGKLKILYDFKNDGDGDGPNVAPVYKGGYLYILSAGTLLKLRANTGAVIWDTAFTQDQGGFGIYLTLHNGTLYGDNPTYGPNGAGTLFSASTATGAVTTLYAFPSEFFASAAGLTGDTIIGPFNSIDGSGGTTTQGIFTYNLSTGAFSDADVIPGLLGAVKLGRLGYGLFVTPGSNGTACSLYSIPLPR